MWKLQRGEFVPFVFDGNGERFRVVKVHERHRLYDVVKESAWSTVVMHKDWDPKEFGDCITFEAVVPPEAAKANDDRTIKVVNKLRKLVLELAKGDEASYEAAKALQLVLEEWS